MGLRLASESTTDLTLTDGTTVTVREDISKAEMKSLLKGFPRRSDIEETGLTPDEGVDFQAALFETLVTAWSLDFPATKASYLRLATPDPMVDELDTKLAEHFEGMQSVEEATAKKR